MWRLDFRTKCEDRGFLSVAGGVEWALIDAAADYAERWMAFRSCPRIFHVLIPFALSAM